jgi:hypothetical protein
LESQKYRWSAATGGGPVLRNPYIAGVERFEAPFSTSRQTSEPSQFLERAAHFCLLLWQQFQPDMRTMRYTLNRDYLADITIEYTQQPRFDELVHFEARDIQQIDIEFISQHPAATGRDLHPHFGQRDEHFPAFLEVFIPLRQSHPQPGTASPEYFAEGHLVIWCRPNLLPKITALWEYAATLLINQP